MESNRIKDTVYSAAGIIALLTAWEIASQSIGSSLILPGPFEVGGSLLRFGGEAKFWLAVLGTFRRVLTAFALTMVLGSTAGVAAALSRGIDRFIAPLLASIRATPVLALILLAMFWLPSDSVPIFSSFLMAFPVVFTSVKAGIAAVDKELLEMALVFKVPKLRQLSMLRIPSASMHFLSAMKNALGLCWKVVVAGEVLAQPLRALGTGMQDSRLALETSEVFSWAIVTIVLCGISEFSLGLLYNRARLVRSPQESDQ
ncbi:MAG: NitT/TauT family transport system permease protein [Spirochaetes bacterium]|nr:MAG: NitT/TauT family transport system permease protein [Spirochaetota bacterium]